MPKFIGNNGNNPIIPHLEAMIKCLPMWLIMDNMAGYQ